MSKTGSRTFSLLLIEAAIAVACGLAAIGLRFGHEAYEVLGWQLGWLKILLSTAIIQACFYLFDLYDLRMIRQRSVLFIRILQALGLASIALATIFYMMPGLTIGRGVFLIGILLTLSMMMCWRLFAMWALGHPKMSERVLILGTGAHAVDLAREVLERGNSGFEVIGFAGDDPSLVGKSLINPCVLGVTDDLEAIVRAHRIDRIVVAVEDRRGRLPVDSLLRLTLPDEVIAEESVSFFESLTGKVHLELVRPSWLIFRQGSRRAIFIEYGLPQIVLLEVMAHEYAHAWQCENCPENVAPEVQEGFAEWVAYKLLQGWGCYRRSDRMLRRDDLYGRGLKMVLGWEKQGGVAEVFRRVAG